MLEFKSQITNPKSHLVPSTLHTRALGARQTNSKFQYPNSKLSVSNLWFLICGLFVICNLVLGIYADIYALNLDTIKIYYLKGDYKQAILEGERILAHSKGSRSDLDELYYFLGLSYLKDGNYLRASDIFEIILSEFEDSGFIEEAKLGLGDAYFLRGDFAKAQGYYRELINSNPNTKLKSQINYRLNQMGFKSNNAQFYYTVQVGSFSHKQNAINLMQKLIQKGYPAYVEEANLAEGEAIYRIRVGKLTSRSQAQELENKLILEGYPTKIYP